jgi:osmoprotectant transport system permease protein
LAFVVGGGGLGDLIFTGIVLYDAGLMLAGAIPTTLLAVVIDSLLGVAERALTPKGLQRSVNPL